MLGFLSPDESAKTASLCRQDQGGGSLEAARGAHLYLCNSRQSVQITNQLGSLSSMHEGGQFEHA